MPWLKLKHSSKYCLCCRCQLLLLFRIYDSKYKHPQEVPIASQDKNFKLRACVVVVPIFSELLVLSSWEMCPWGWGKRWIYWQGCRWSRSQLPPCWASRYWRIRKTNGASMLGLVWLTENQRQKTDSGQSAKLKLPSFSHACDTVKDWSFSCCLCFNFWVFI
jgi:hypothetical protein